MGFTSSWWNSLAGFVPPPGTSSYKAYMRATGSTPSQASAAYAAQQAVPPVGTSAYKAYLHTQRTGSPPSVLTGSGRPDSPAAPVSAPAPASGSETASQPQMFDYLDAPWASAYGMSRETAYSEAMENTAYRRSVQDMQKAGLNPAVIFGAGNGYTAGSPAYVSSAPSGSGSGFGSVSRSGSGRGRSNDKLFSSSAYAVMSTLGGIVGAAATKSVGGYWLGVSLTQGAMNAMNLLYKR